MSGNQTFRSKSAVALNEVITNLQADVAGVEYNHSLHSGLKQLMIKVRTPVNAQLQFSYVVAESATKFITLPPGTSYSLENINFTGKTLYIQSNKASTVIEIEELY